MRFEIGEPPLVAGYCHCTRCQRRTGTGSSVQAFLAPGSFRIVAGEDLTRAFDPGDGGFLKVFCSACGSALWSRHPTDPDRMSVRLGVLDSDPGIRPSFRQFVAYAPPWDELPDDGLPRFEESRA